MLDLSEFGDGSIPAITPAVGNMLAEGAGVCLESQGHALGVELVVRGGERGRPAVVIVVEFGTPIAEVARK